MPRKKKQNQLNQPEHRKNQFDQAGSLDNLDTPEKEKKTLHFGEREFYRLMTEQRERGLQDGIAQSIREQIRNKKNERASEDAVVDINGNFVAIRSLNNTQIRDLGDNCFESCEYMRANLSVLQMKIQREERRLENFTREARFRGIMSTHPLGGMKEEQATDMKSEPYRGESSATQYIPTLKR